MTYNFLQGGIVTDHNGPLKAVVCSIHRVRYDMVLESIAIAGDWWRPTISIKSMCSGPTNA
eukprot:scaffold19681_cov90-Skeletonema_dohrnii-CCMP3373.AAC.1